MTNLIALICTAALASCTQAGAPLTETTSPSALTPSVVERPAADRPILYECNEDICSIGRNGRNRRVLVDRSGAQYLAQWAPDGKSFSFLDVVDRGADLWVAGRDGSGARRVARNVDEFYDWAPDSEHLVVSRSTFIDYTLGFDSDLYVLSADGTDTEQLTDSDLPESMPVWSPDGRSIAFTGAARTRDGVNLDIYSLDLATHETTRLTDHPAQDQEPLWSPDGRYLAFLSARHDPYDSEYGPYTGALYLIEVSSGEEIRLTRGDRSKDREHVWSPDGSALAYTRGWDDDVARRRPDVGVVTLDGEITLLAPGSEPEWSQDGGSVAFARDGRDMELWVMRRDGSEATVLTNNRTHDSRPAW